jgi:hypothetical protein
VKILNFSLFYGELTHKVNLDLGLYIISKNGNQIKSSKILNCKHGISWEYNTIKKDLLEVIIQEEGKRIIGYPSPNMDVMAVLYPWNSEYYPAPKNMVIYNVDGTIKHILSPPNLVSEKAKQIQKNPFEENKTGTFLNVRWATKNLNKPVFVVDIQFGGEWVETWELDPYKGEFKHLLHTWRM